MMALPIIEGGALFGVLQLMNHRGGRPFSGLEFEGAIELSRTLATALRQRMHGPGGLARPRPTRYDGLLAAGVLTADELQACIRQARELGQELERLLLTDWRVRPELLGASLSRYFGVPYEPYRRARIRSAPLHGVLKRVQQVRAVCLR